jgi:hypothetical protein
MKANRILLMSKQEVETNNREKIIIDDAAKFVQKVLEIRIDL